MSKLYSIFIITLIFLSMYDLHAQNKKDSIRGQVLNGTTNDFLTGVDIFGGHPKRLLGVTKADGYFVVSAKVGDMLDFLLVGFDPIRVEAAPGNMMVSLRTKKGELDGVTVMGFRNVKRELTTGATATITAEDIKDQPAASVVDLLQGKFAGLNIQNNTGQPGAIGTINMRGLNGGDVSGTTGFLSPTSPLFVIDGVPVDANTDFSYGANSGGPGLSPLALIPPEDIESVTVLKDAAASALWGSRGAYGVIIVTTKRGKSKVPIVDFNGMYFYSAVPNLRPTLGGKDERDQRILEILNNDTTINDRYSLTLINRTPLLSDSLNPYYNNATDWQRVFYLPKSNYSANLNISGGDDKFNYKTAFNYYHQNGIIEGTGFDRYSLNMNGLFQPSPKFSLRVAINSAVGAKKNGSGVGLLQTGVANSASVSSLLPGPSRYSANSAATASLAISNSTQTIQIIPSIDVTYRPIPSLSINSQTNFNLNSNSQDSYQPGYTNNNFGYTLSYNDRTYSLYSRNSLNYLKVVQDKHTFNAYVFSEINTNNFVPTEYHLRGSSNDFIQSPGGYYLYTSGFGTLTSASQYRTAAFGGSFEYNFKRKYIIDFQYRTDKSSNNGPLAGWQKNPTFSARWNFNKENFMNKFSSWLDYGSIRASYGKIITPTGNIFSTYGTYNSMTTTYNGAPTVAIDNSLLPNANFKPTRVSTLDLGFEIGLWKNKVSFVYDYYYKQNNDMSMNVALPSTSGFGSYTTNDYAMVNYGHEFTLNIRPLPSSSNWVWNLSMNLSINKNVLAKLPNSLRQMTTGAGGDVPILHRLGRNDITMLVYNTEGVYTKASDIPVDPFTGLPMQIRNVSTGVLTYAKVGDPKWTDVNGDYIIDQNDLLPLGNPIPKLTGGINSNLMYKNWSLTTAVSFTLLRDVINSALAERLQDYGTPFSQSNLYPISDLNFYSPSNTNGKYAYPFDYMRYAAIDPFRENQTIFMEDGSYWKLNQVTISYALDPKIVARLKMSQIRVYVTGNNLLILSPYSGSNPENVSSSGRDLSGGYPNPRNYTIGVQVRF